MTEGRVNTLYTPLVTGLHSSAMDAFAVAPVAHPWRKTTAGLALVVGIGVALWLSSRYSYLLFHGVSEMFGIAVACSVFMFSWSSRGYPAQRPFVLLGIGYLFVALLDLFHTLSYQGMTVLPADQDYATRLWIAARGLQALVTIIFVVSARLRRETPFWLPFLIFGGLCAAAVLSIFWWNTFPVCFVEGQGVTPFKVGSEYVISAILAASIVLLAGNSTIGRQERNLLALAFGLNIASELAFTLYTSAYGFQNLAGHFLKIGSFALAYQALFASEVRRRIRLIGELEASNARLEKSEKELRKANASKDRFFSIIAHDLRNPIGGILSISEVLAKRFEQLEPARVKELCDLVHDGARGGAELLETILQWARAQTGRLEVKPSRIRLAQLCEGIIGLHGTAAESKSITIRAKVPAEEAAFADENMLATILRNLLSNAVKFTPRGGEVEVSASRQGEWEKLSVRDTGIGMSGEDVKKLFRIDTHYSCPGTDQERGNGMGLILCKELVDLNRGMIRVESEPGKGSTFTLLLPAGPREILV